MSDLPALLQRNKEFAADFRHGDLPIRPRLSTIVLTCLDARVDPAHVLGLEPGDALVIRNAGGRVTPEVEHDIAILGFLTQRMAGGGPPLEVMIMHHTDCGAERFADPDVRKGASAGLGLDESQLEAMAIGDHSQSLRDDVARLREAGRMPDGLTVSGHLYDVRTGGISQVVGSITSTTTNRTEFNDDD